MLQTELLASDRRGPGAGLHGERLHLVAIQARYHFIDKEHDLVNTNVFDVNIEKAFKHLFHNQR